MPSALASGRGLFFILVLYVLAHGALRLAFSGHFVTDDAASVLTVTGLKLVYSIYQPPLYEWVFWVAKSAFGVNMVSVFAAKYAFLGGAAFFLYRSATIVTAERGLAVLAVLSYSLFYQIGWNLLEGVSHTNALIFSSSMTLYAFLAIMKDGRGRAYILLGLGIGLGLLSKFSYPLFFSSLLVAALTFPPARARLDIRLLLVALLAGILLALPFYAAILADGKTLGLLSGKMGAGGQDASFLRLFAGPAKVAASFALYGLALVPAFLFLFGRNLSRAALWRGGSGKGEDYAAFCARAFAISFLIVFAAALLADAGHIKERHMHPFFLPLPLAFFAALSREEVRERDFRRFRRLLLAVALAVFAVRFAVLAFPYEEICGRCRERIPYEALARRIVRYTEIRHVVAMDVYTAANLMRLVPEKRVILAGAGPNAATHSMISCLIVRQAALKGGDPEAAPGGERVTGGWFALGGKAPMRETEWRLAAAGGKEGGDVCRKTAEDGL